MSIVEHIKEFRRRLLISLAGILIGTVVGFIWYDSSFLSFPTLGELLRDPYCSLPAEARYAFSESDECRLLATGPFDPFMLRLKVSALVGLVLASPVWLSQLWGFITPGLMKNERRYTAVFVSIAVLLFVGGAVLAYFVVSYGLEFLLTIGGDTQAAALTGERYFNFLLALLMIFGVSFEVPLVIGMLNVVGILTYDAIKDKRRMIIMILFVFAAFMTPGQDPFTMLVLALSLTVLVELAIQFCRFNDKRRAKKRPEWLDSDDLSASPLDTSSGGEDAPRPVSTPTPVAPSEMNNPSNEASISYKTGRADFGDVL
ncbi:twin-arginine translocase subunit TatC [Corynebacterium crudilactis]|uniref:Sec-independent protein translocase protein TatC n=1 Tax=Corynebacterium crudilactis TaxID=1652495 RepID=A0A172QTP1_9CORY|nr:twin-arginine translocase subunit TatC [Corynebacterium crudilactis]ANE04018.1 twin arginine-targeting protein translocase TatC [Corynebacterium crudilactis]